MRISHIADIEKPNFIIVRNYGNENIVHYPRYLRFHRKIENKVNEIGQWKIKYFNHVPKELNEIIEFEKL